MDVFICLSLFTRRSLRGLLPPPPNRTPQSRDLAAFPCRHPGHERDQGGGEEQGERDGQAEEAEPAAGGRREEHSLEGEEVLVGSSGPGGLARIARPGLAVCLPQAQRPVPPPQSNPIQLLAATTRLERTSCGVLIVA